MPSCPALLALCEGSVQALGFVRCCVALYVFQVTNWAWVLRGIFGPTKENRTWRIRNNEQLDKLIKHEYTVNYIKAQRLSRFGHIQRMPEARAAKEIFKWNPLTARPRGRPKYRWEDNITQDLGQMKIKK